MGTALLTLVVVLLAGAALGTLAWVHGWSFERYTRPLSAAATEAAERTEDFVAHFRDWLRLGR